MNKKDSDVSCENSELKIILVRAGATELDSQGRITGALDLPMCEEAEQHVRKTAAQLSFFSIETIYASACEAARQTAKLLSSHRKIKVKISPDLANLDCGLWHGKRIDEVKQTQPKLFRKWAEMLDGVCPPDGETLADARDRVAAFFSHIEKRHPSGTIAVVAPQPLFSVIRCFLDPAAEPEPWTTVSQSGKWEEVTLAKFGASPQGVPRPEKTSLQPS